MPNSLQAQFRGLGALRGRPSPANRAPAPAAMPLLQRAPSSCACGGACPRCQAKSNLTIGAPDDHYEREADRVADAVVSGSQADSVQGISSGMQFKLARKVLEPSEMYDSVMPPDNLAEGLPEAEVPEPENLQRSATGEAGSVTPQYEQSLQQAMQGGGEGLAPTTKSFMESRFGQDFSGVRVHRDSQAGELAKQVNARAFTVGSDIFFNPSEYAPSSREGQHLLAHELTHVVQQSSGRLSRQIRRAPGGTPCSSYPGYDASVDRRTYNCSGLALRTYTWISPPSAVYAAMWANFMNPVCPVGNCGPGQVRLWLWQYDIRLEDDRGIILQPTWRDFHIVGGRTDASGNDPTNVYSKNGPRPIHGPGTGPSFRPAARDRALDQDDNPATTQDGHPVYKIRSNMSEEITCAGCG
ncbi:MAG: DUF4157 domain-containing protein [Rubrivivax sp.]|nr:MAG: DUF4157 domain-containing protein [Rubrivivax sp.]